MVEHIRRIMVTDAMALELLEGRRTQWRQRIKLPPLWNHDDVDGIRRADGHFVAVSRSGREGFEARLVPPALAGDTVELAVPMPHAGSSAAAPTARGRLRGTRWAVVAVAAKRLTEISVEDAEAEGFDEADVAALALRGQGKASRALDLSRRYGDRAVTENAWSWVVTIARVTP